MKNGRNQEKKGTKRQKLREKKKKSLNIIKRNVDDTHRQRLTS